MIKNLTKCPFCNIDYTRTWCSNRAAVAVLDEFPVSRGHTLIVPRRHVSSYFELTEKEQKGMWDLVNEMKGTLDAFYEPDGYNIGINVGEAAGQTVPHVHIHIIPRYKGDVPDPRGGVRGVIPDKQKY